MRRKIFYPLTAFILVFLLHAIYLVGGLTLTGVLYIGGCFLLGCCGSPMLAVYLGLFGSSFLGFTRPNYCGNNHCIKGDCCVFCSYGSVKCPSKQKECYS